MRGRHISTSDVEPAVYYYWHSISSFPLLSSPVLFRSFSSITYPYFLFHCMALLCSSHITPTDLQGAWAIKRTQLVFVCRNFVKNSQF